MSRGKWPHLTRGATIERTNHWQNLAGFVERRPGVWEPEDYTPTPWEIQAPTVITEADAHREYVLCSKSLAYFLLVHGWTLHGDDPERPQWRKFPSYPYLRQFFQDVQVPQNVLCEKSRQMMMSWAWMGVFLWDISFHENWGNLVISMRANEVDNGTYNSLLGKIKHIWMALPPYLQQPLTFKQYAARHEAIGSFVQGETGAATGGRGSTAKRALIDEASRVEPGEAVFKSVRQVAKNGVILNSTPQGKGNTFSRIRFDRDTTFRKFTIHWTMHPEKAAGLYCTCGWIADPTTHDEREQFLAHDCLNLKLPEPKRPEARSPWYDHECRDLTPTQVASELDISYEESVQGRVYAFFDQTRSTLDHEARVGVRGEREALDRYREKYLRAVIEPELPLVVGWDFGVSDPTSLLLGQVLSEEQMLIRWLDEYENQGQSWTHYRDFIWGLWQPLSRELTGKNLMHYGDPAGYQRSADLTSWVTNLAANPSPLLKIVVVTGPKNGTKLEWLDFIGNLMRKGSIQVSTHCYHLIDALQNYRYPSDPKTGELIPGKQEPVHDEWSHACDALRYVYSFRWSARLQRVDNSHRVASAAFGIGKGKRDERRSF